MPQDKKAAKERYNQIRKQQLASSPKFQSAEGAKWPITRCLMAGNWDNPTSLMAGLIIRTHPTSGQMCVGIFLIDLACMGVKSATGRFSTPGDLTLIEQNFESMPPVRSVAPGTLVMLINAAHKYAADLGISPDPDYANAKLLLKDITPEPQPATLRFGGQDGKPFYISGPDDDADAIIRKLTQKLGPDGFAYVKGSPD
jgi:hypothetical protein